MKVSVWITAYNHERFIEQALDSVLRQKTNFDFEVVIGEDCSSDRTREIILRYKAQYTDKIKLFLPDKNLGVNPMFYASFPLCDGDYIAWLDGDDYWTDDYKLQKQVDFLEQNPEFVMCTHKLYVQDEILNISYESEDEGGDNENILTIRDFLEIRNPVFPVSVIHRNVLGGKLPEWFKTLPFADLGFYFLLFKYGVVKQLKDNMAVYRIHKAGSYQGNTEYKNFNDLLSFFQILVQHIDPALKEQIEATICRLSLILLKMNMEKRKFKEAWKNLDCLKTNHFKQVDKYLWKSLKKSTPTYIKHPFKRIASIFNG
ncbi:glycosyltransferase family 2 protein [Flavisolibacter tropicus]|uniref:glycosyltransferase family 2 protein n=1 Tax=Flavisolibacter tropicus TaxID=1492898 RepID=UPI0008377F83|nr:glycosyltransferase [Flavisolibacter tropicus]